MVKGKVCMRKGIGNDIMITETINNMDAKDKIILALDVADFQDALDIVKKFKDHIDIFKVGAELFTAVGPKIVDEINSMGKKVFLDLKYHDIPSTVSMSALAAAQLGVFMFTVHTMGGLKMMQQAVGTLVGASLKRNIDRPKILGVTILTSIDSEALINELGILQNMETQIKHLSSLALKAGLDGVVASPLEVEMIRSRCDRGFLIVTPGIRPSWAAQDDQRRTMTPRKALNLGADYLVIGRAILSQPDPIKALERVIEEMNA